MNPAFANPDHLDDRGINVWLAEQARTAADPRPYLDRLERRGAICQRPEVQWEDCCDWPEQSPQSV